MKTAPTWKRVLAFIIDLIGSFVVFGYLIALATNNIVSGGFSLSGVPAVLLFVIMIVYFVGMNRWLGGTLAKHLLRIPSKKTK